MDEVAALLERMRELEPQVFVHGPAEDQVIQQLEGVFGRPMPRSYRAFLLRFGAVSIVDSSYSGVIDGESVGAGGCVGSDNQRARELCQLPAHYLVIQPDQDGFTCLDFRRSGLTEEPPVIYHVPFRMTPFHELAPSYGAWLRDDLQAMIAAWEDG